MQVLTLSIIIDFDLNALKAKAELLDSLSANGSIDDLHDVLEELKKKAEAYDYHCELLQGRPLEDVLDELERLKAQN